jgi:hypothetical protein
LSPEEKNHPPQSGGFWLYAGLFLVSCSMLMLETLTTRVLTITTGSQMALITVSLAMFGLSAGAIYVLLYPAGQGSGRLARASLAYAVSVMVTFFGQLHLQQAFEPGLWGTLSSLVLISLTTVPYCLGGVCVSTILSQAAEKVGKLYAIDLLGAAVGAWLMVALLGHIGGETAVLCAAWLGALGSLALSRAEAQRAWPGGLLVLGLLALAFANERYPWLSIPGPTENPYELVRWNSYSRVTAQRRSAPPGWGLSERFPGPYPEHYWLEIDGTSGTPVIAFDGQPDNCAYLAADVTALPFHLRRKARVAILGAGGGKDVLTSLVFGNSETTGVEINDQIVRLLEGPLRSFSGGLVDRVAFLAADARTWMAQQQGSFDIIQLAMVDNANAFASGAITLSENGLYTREAWHLFGQHLSSRGVLSVSMGYYQEESAEILRCLKLGATTLRSLGIEPDEQHFLVSRKAFAFKAHPDQPDGVFTLMMGKQPFAPQDLENFRWLNEQFGFESVLPGDNPDLLKLARGQELTDCAYDLTEATDAHPFFFFSARLSKLGHHTASLRAILFLVQLLMGSAALVGLCCLMPWWVGQQKDTPWESKPDRPLLYFLALGLGYMLVEMSFAQQFCLFLGNPTWSLCVVLSTMLLCSAVGSACSGYWEPRARWILGLLVLILALTQGCLPWVTSRLASSAWHLRVLVSSLMMAPAAVLMGIPFPVGMRRAQPSRLPWCWALNGAGSLLAGPLALATAVLWGIPQVLLLGVACYLAAGLLLPSGRVAG